MLRRSVNRATTRYISAGAHAHASNANTAAQASQPRMRRPSGYEGTAIAARSRTVPHGLEAGLRIDISRGENIGRRHQKAGRRVWIADAEVEGLVALEDVLDLREGAVFVHDDVGVIAVVSVAGTSPPARSTASIPDLFPYQAIWTLLKRIPSMTPA